MPSPTGAPLERPALAQPMAGNLGSRETFLAFDSPGGIARMGRLKLRGDRSFRIEIGLNGGDLPQIVLGSGGQTTPDVRIYRPFVGRLEVSGNSQANTIEFATVATAGQLSRISAYVAGDSVQRATLAGDATQTGLFFGSGAAAQDLRIYRRTGQTMAVQSPVGSNATEFDVIVGGESQPRVGIYVGTTGGQVFWGDGTGTVDVALLRTAAKTIQLNDNAGGTSILDLGGFGRLTLPRNTVVESVAGRVRWATETDATTGARLLLYDSQRERDMASVGWTPMALPMGAGPDDVYATALALPINGGSIAIPMWVTGHMMWRNLQYRVTAASGTAEFRLYRQRLNNANASENTVDEVPNSAGTIGANGAAATTFATITSPNLYLGPGAYILVIRCTSATTAFNLGTLAGGTLQVNTSKTKTLGAGLGATLDFVAAAWVGQAAIPGVALIGAVFGQAAAY